MKVIDSHCHLGACSVFGYDIDEESLLKNLEDNKVDAAIVQPFPGAQPDAKSVHDRIYKLSKKYPKKIFGIASINPNFGEKQTRYEIERCIKDLGFVGVKCHTLGHAANPILPAGDLIFKIASELNVPVNVHTGQGIVFAAPSLNILKARQYPNLKIVLIHSGMIILTPEAFIAAKEAENIYLETSWNAAEDIEWLITTLGSNRVMFGSDSYTKTMLNQKVELFKYKIINISEEQRVDVLFNTAKEVYKLNL